MRKIGDYVIIRARDAGVHVGEFQCRLGREVLLYNARRIWSWEGAFDLNQLAVYGSLLPNKCKITCIVPEIEVLDACEVIICSKKAEQFFRTVKETIYEI